MSHARNAALGSMSPVVIGIYDTLTEAARMGRPCPTNAVLADQFGYASLSGPCKALERLEQAGLIRIERMATTRRVTILETGQQTWARSGAPHFTNADRPAGIVKPLSAASADNDELVTIESPRVDREPCWRCGVRGDVGCAHQRPEWQHG